MSKYPKIIHYPDCKRVAATVIKFGKGKSHEKIIIVYETDSKGSK